MGGAAADAVAELKELKEVFAKAKIIEPLQKWLMEAKGMESVSDFYYCFKAATHQDEIVDMLGRSDDFKDQPVQVARCRAAWTSAGIVMEALTKPKTDIAPTQDDLDMPLSDTVKEELDKAWDARYHLVIELRLTPPDALVARKYRDSTPSTPSGRHQEDPQPFQRVQAQGAAPRAAEQGRGAGDGPRRCCHYPQRD